MPTGGCQLNVMIDVDKRDRFKNKVRGEGKTINEVVNELIDAYLANTNLPNQANQDELEKAIANSNKFQELTRALENHDTTLDLLSRMIEEIKNKLDNETTPSDSSNNQVNQEDEREISLISSEGEEIVTPEKLPSEDEQEEASKDNQDISVIEELKPDTAQLSEVMPPKPTNQEKIPSFESNSDNGKLKGEDETDGEDNEAIEEGLSGVELADQLGVRSEYLTRWKSGKNIPKEDSENYQAYQEFTKYCFEKREGDKRQKYYLIKK